MSEDGRSVAVLITISSIVVFDITGYLILRLASFDFGNALLAVVGILGGVVGLALYNRVRTVS
jgi:hypothetical protein